MAAESDEELAGQLQAEFDVEEAVYQQQVSKDAKVAAKVAKAHEISDSDSDDTIELPDFNSSWNGSQDLFDSTSSFNRNSPSTSGSREKPGSNSKQRSKTHEISDSGSDCDSTVDKARIRTGEQVQCKKSLTFSSNASFSVNRTSSAVHPVKLEAAHGKHLGSPQGQQTSRYNRKSRANPEYYQDFHESEEDRNKRTSSALLNKADVMKKKVKREEEEMKSDNIKQESRAEFAKTVADVFAEFQPVSFFLTKVSGIDHKFNSTGAISMKDILSPLMGNLQASCQFNFMFDIPWLVKQYPKQFRDKPMLLVHGEKGRYETELKKDAAAFPQIMCCRAKLEIMYGTHHTKMMLLLYDCGMRVVIHTANLISNDWHQKTQGVWISPLFPKLPDDTGASASNMVRGDSTTRFKTDLMAYVAAYDLILLKQWHQHLQQHDFSAASVYIIGSVPGRHTGIKRSAWGHMKLRQVLREAGPVKQVVDSWPVIGQFSSIGSLGATPEQWLCSEWLESFSQCKGTEDTVVHPGQLQLVYPSKENVRLCLEGYSGGGCLPYSIETARKQIYLNNFLRKWGSEGRGRTEAIPHIKTYTRVSPDYAKAAWFLVTSANLSRAAWGSLEKQRAQLMIRSYEIGILFLPEQFGCGGSFLVARRAEEVCASESVMLPFPFDLPPPLYQKGDRIWMWDVPCVDLPDTHGKKYCPRL